MTAGEAPTPEAAQRFVDEAGFVWHQRFKLAPGVYTPGQNDLEPIFRDAAVPDDLSGKTALDIGTSNGGAAFELERRGAERVVAVDIYPESWFGFDALKNLLGSRVRYVEASVYELGTLLREEFDLVLFWGVSTTSATHCTRSTISGRSCGEPRFWRRPCATPNARG